MNTFETLIGLLGGLGLFLYGMKLMGDGLESAAGEKLKGILEKLTQNRYIGAVVGMLVTAVIQSSSATTVMVVSFVNAGLMTLMQAAGVIMGANIGTTITAQMISFKLDHIAPLFVGLGAITMLIVKKKRHKDIASIALGFGILFMGMGIMSGAMKPISETPWFTDLIITVSKNTFLGILAGLSLTAIIQSSSATTGILVALSIAGAIDMSVALPMILGCNIGTCVTALLASLGANNTGKKAAFIHLGFNIFGVILFMPFIQPLIEFVEALNPDNVARQVANAHTIFNVITALIMLPFAGVLVNLVNKILPENEKVDKEGAIYLDPSFLETPMVAIAQVYKETLRMADKAKQNLELAMEGFLTNNMEMVSKVYANEKIINALEKEITDYLVDIAQLDVPQEDIKHFGVFYHVINDIERIGDHAENIADLATEKINHTVNIGEEATQELKLIYKKTVKALDMAIESYSNPHIKVAETIDEIENEIDVLERELRNKNIQRLNDKKCSANGSVIFLDVISNFERIGDHANNISKSKIS